MSVLAELKIITTTTTLKSLVEKVGGKFVTVESITKGPQDPHFVEAKPSYMVKLRRADLIVSVGLDLEVGWLPNIIRGARNPNLIKGKPGHLKAGQLIEPIEVPKGSVSRAQGDIHGFGNPHFLLDPDRAIQVGQGISEKLTELDPKNKSGYEKNFSTFKNKTLKLTRDWELRVAESGIANIVTYHKTLNYFLQRFKINLSGSIEPQPGIPPTAKQIIALIKKIKKDKVVCILNESFFEKMAAERLKKDTPVTVKVVATEVGATPQAKNYFELVESLVSAVESCKKRSQTNE